MKVPYDWPKCILCCEKPADSWEHLFPKAIGGRFQQKLLCTKCNKYYGSILASKIKTDPWVRQAAARVCHSIPKLYAQLEEHQRDMHLADDSVSFESLKKKENKRIRTRRLEDGHLLFDPRKPPKPILDYLANRISNQLSEKNLKKLLQEIGEAHDAVIEKNGELKGLNADHHYPAFVNTVMDDRACLLIVLEYLALRFGEGVYSDQLDWLRDTIRGEEIPPDCRILLYGGSIEQAIHVIYANYEKQTLTVTIKFFSTCIKIVTLEINIPVIDFPVIIEDLRSGETCFANSFEDGKKYGFWTVSQ